MPGGGPHRDPRASWSVDLAIGVASTGDAEGELEAILARLDEATPIGESIRVASARAVAVARTRDTAVALASA